MHPPAQSGLRLHLGCGQRYLEGYVNVDLPDGEHTVQQERQVDLVADLRELDFAPGSCLEVRHHHVFEHFTRAEALRMLLVWHDWLANAGVLCVETPDLERSLPNLLPGQSPALRGKTLRHLFGSQEAGWAAHLDAWDEARFRHTLPQLGFVVDRVEHDSWQDLHNVTVHAHKLAMPFEQRWQAALGLLDEALVDQSVSELRLRDVWLAQLQLSSVRS